MEKLKDNLIVRLLLGVALGLVVGLNASAQVIGVIDTIKFLLGQIIFFTVPLIIFGFIAPAITQMKANASKMLGAMVGLAYTSSVCAAIMSMVAGYAIIPHLNIITNPEGLKKLPELIFKVEVPPPFSVMTALALALMGGLAVIWTKSEKCEALLGEIQNIMMSIVNKIIIPILPVFVATTFAGLAYEGGITKQLPVFLQVIVIVMLGHYIWLAVLYSLAGVISGRNPWEVLKHYGPAYLTAVGTMSSAATLPIALSCARK